MLDTVSLQRDIEWDVLWLHRFTGHEVSEEFAEGGQPTSGDCTCGWSGMAEEHNTHLAQAMVEWLLLHLSANGEDTAEAVKAFKHAWHEADEMHRDGLRTQSGIEALVALGWRKVNTSDA